MADLLGKLVDAHGGLERWNELETVPRTPDGQALTEPLLISIDLSEITFT